MQKADQGSQVADLAQHPPAGDSSEIGTEMGKAKHDASAPGPPPDEIPGPLPPSTKETKPPSPLAHEEEKSQPVPSIKSDKATTLPQDMPLLCPSQPLPTSTSLPKAKIYTTTAVPSLTPLQISLSQPPPHLSKVQLPVSPSIMGNPIPTSISQTPLRPQTSPALTSISVPPVPTTFTQPPPPLPQIFTSTAHVPSISQGTTSMTFLSQAPPTIKQCQSPLVPSMSSLTQVPPPPLVQAVPVVHGAPIIVPVSGTHMLHASVVTVVPGTQYSGTHHVVHSTQRAFHQQPEVQQRPPSEFSEHSEYLSMGHGDDDDDDRSFLDPNFHEFGSYMEQSYAGHAYEGAVAYPSGFRHHRRQPSTLRISKWVNPIPHDPDDGQQQAGEQELATKMLQIQSKRFYIDVKQNRRGRFMKVAEIGADGRRNQVFLALSTAAEFRDHLSLFSDFYANLGPPNPDTLPEDGKLKSETMVKDNRRYYLDLKENSRGRFLRVSQTIARGGPRCQIAIPAQGMIEFRDALQELLDEFGTDDGGYKGELPEGRHMRVENKNFYFDIGQNNRGIYMRISEVKTNFRTAITIPEKSWSRFRDIFSDYVDKMKDGAEKGPSESNK